ncbi:MAG TPA: ABC transporter permease [Bryobacteraceae bacterium]|jgi:lipoprotein-releasing system permease protein
MFELFVALRYLRAKRKQAVISVVTVISVVGVTAGVMALVIALAINTGFRNTLERNLLSATAEVRVQAKGRDSGIEGWEAVAQKLTQMAGVRSAVPGLYMPALLSGVNSDYVVVKGVSLAPGVPISPALLHLRSGAVEGLKASGDELPGIILGSKLAEKIGIDVGKPARLLIPDGRATPYGMVATTEKVRVAGVFESGFLDVDSNWAFMLLPAEQQVFGLGDVVNSIELTVDNLYDAPKIAEAADKVVGPDLAAIPWQEENSELLHTFEMERMVTIVTIGLIQLVAALNILIALVMMVMEKHRDIAILMSMGARVKQIRRIFLLEGALIGASGTVLGLILGYTISYFADKYHWLSLNAQLYGGLSSVPFETHVSDGIWIAAGAMAVSLVATLYPARSATRIAPVEALRYE